MVRPLQKPSNNIYISQNKTGEKGTQVLLIRESETRQRDCLRMPRLFTTTHALTTSQNSTTSFQLWTPRRTTLLFQDFFFAKHSFKTSLDLWIDLSIWQLPIVLILKLPEAFFFNQNHLNTKNLFLSRQQCNICMVYLFINTRLLRLAIQTIMHWSDHTPKIYIQKTFIPIDREKW